MAEGLDMARKINDDDVYRDLVIHVQKRGSIRDLANELGIQQTFVSAAKRRTVPMPSAIAEHLGYELKWVKRR